MSSKNSKQSTKTVTETPVEPTLAATPVVAATPAQKGSKKATAKQPVEPVVAAPVVAEAVAAPVVAPAQKGGKKVAAKQSTDVKQSTASTPVVAEAAAAPVVAEAAVAPAAKKGAKKAADKPAAAPAQKGANKAAAKQVTTAAPKKAAKKVVEKSTAQAGGEEEVDEESGDRRIRSFKVKLPNREDFEGRFTGLTPYQAANKALSKYFRETEKPLVEVTFSICESTRKSRKSVYTYVGKRQKLEIPVVYKIHDGREIVKSFKNSLKKVKKSESSALASA